jgi:RND family efflux transporter MFP subunit
VNAFTSFIKSRRKLSVIILVAILALGGTAAVLATRGAQAAKGQPETNVTVLAETDLDQIITTKGVLQSTMEHTVYTLLNYKVQEVAVEVGDTVQPGDFLAQLETTDVERSIADLERSIRTAGSQSTTQISQAQRSVNEAREQKAIDARNLQDAIERANKDIELIYHQADDAASEAAGKAADAAVASDTRVVNARSVMTAAQNAMNAQRLVVKSLASTDEGYAAAVADYEAKKAVFEKAEKAYDDTYERIEDKIWQEEFDEAYDDVHDTFANQIIARHTAYDQAVLNLEANQRANDLAIKARADALTNQKLMDSTSTLESQLATARTNLADARIVTPVGGTVTNVMASIGNRANGAMVTIQNPKSLEIIATIPEYDIPLIEIGQAVRFTTDATGSDEFEGVVERISPTAVNTDGDFEVTVNIGSPDSRLRIGMNAKLTIVLESRKNIFSVPYDAITIDDAGQTIVTAVRDDGVTRYEIPVQVGMETDYFVEISGADLAAGLTILNDPQGKNVVSSNMASGPFGAR